MVLLGEGALPAPGKEQEIAAAVGTKSPTSTRFFKMDSTTGVPKELLTEGGAIGSKPADGQNSSQSSDPIPEAGG
jgi:hypothetical protein